ncbi:MAG: hypothetical protein IT362_03675 [Deltaproteobacteria bacterium]|nr:hypothetical protein [Deltaproteobacteria bacterium]
MENLKAAQEVHHKFEFYFVALAFTIAAFAIQSGKFSGNTIGDCFEILSWVCITLSGAIGLHKIQYFPVLYRIHDEIIKKEKCIAEYQYQEEYKNDIEELKKDVQKTSQTKKEIEKVNRRKYLLQKVFFIFGMTLLILSRFIYQMQESYWCK